MYQAYCYVVIPTPYYVPGILWLVRNLNIDGIYCDGLTLSPTLTLTLTLTLSLTLSP